MTVEEFVLIRVNKLSKEKLDFFKIIEGEPYHSVFGDLVKFGERYDFKGRRIRNLTKKLEDSNDGTNKTKQKEKS